MLLNKLREVTSVSNVLSPSAVPSTVHDMRHRSVNSSERMATILKVEIDVVIIQIRTGFQSQLAGNGVPDTGKVSQQSLHFPP